MSTSSKRSSAPAATAPPAFPFPRLDQLCLNELLTRDADLARYLLQEDLVQRGKLESANRVPPPELYRDCSYALEQLYALRPLSFSLPHLYGIYCQHPRCQIGMPKPIGLGQLPRYLILSQRGHLLWRCHPDQPFSACRWDYVKDSHARKPVRKGPRLLMWDLERPSGI